MPTTPINNRGIALLITMLLLGTIMASAMGLAVLIMGETKITRSIDDSVLAIFAADAGMEKLFYFVNKLGGNPATDPNFVSTLLPAEATYVACVRADSCSSTRLISTGTYGETRRALEANY